MTNKYHNFLKKRDFTFFIGQLITNLPFNRPIRAQADVVVWCAGVGSLYVQDANYH